MKNKSARLYWLQGTIPSYEPYSGSFATNVPVQSSYICTFKSFYIHNHARINILLHPSSSKWLLREICSCQSKRPNAIELLINRLLLKYKSFWHFMALSQIINIPGPRGNAGEKKHYLTFRKDLMNFTLVRTLHYCRLLHGSRCVFCGDYYIVWMSKVSDFIFLHSEFFIQSD